MTGLVWAGLVAATATGVVVLALIWPTHGHQRALQSLRACLAVLLGLALHSGWYLVWVTLSGGRSDRLAYAVYDAALPVALYLLLRRRSTPQTSAPSMRMPAARPSRAARALLGATFAMCVLSASTLLIALVARQPHGGWDAWAMWNLKARWFALGGDEWARVLTDPVFAIAHPDYPLLLPLTIARLWLFAGGTPPEVPQAFAVAGGLMTIAVLFGSAWAIRGFVAAVVAGASVLLLPWYLAQAAWQYADVPLACLYAATLGAVALAMRPGAGSGPALTAGMLAGAALWTKNEGLLFGVSVLVATLVVGLARGEGRNAWARAGRIGVGALPFITATLLLKMYAATGSDLIAGQTLDSTLTRVTDLARHAQILRFGVVVARMPDWIGLALLGACLVMRGPARELASAGIVALTTLLTALGYYVVLLATPHDLAWHLETAASRLVLHLWPASILALVLSANFETRPGVLTPDPT